MLDVHILVLRSRSEDVVRRCISSVLEAQRQTAFPVAVHVMQAVEGHIGAGRQVGYAQGSHPFVTCVDDDDYVLPHAFSKMSDALNANTAKAISSPEYIIRNGYELLGRQRHHLIAYKRECIINHAAWPCCGDVAQINAIPQDAWTDLQEPSYVHHVYESPAKLMRRDRQQELQRAHSHD